MRLYALTIFTSAFLLFQVQPIIAKLILPWFGGSSAVWTTCLLFFQVVLLLGYLYAHGSVEYVPSKGQRRLHAGLLIASLLTLPIMPSAHWKPVGTGEPTGQVLLLLLVTIGLPYFLLSTTGPLLQAWYADLMRSGAASKGSLYRLYALSNAGSMLALISYPILVEPRLTLQWQSRIWSAGYVLFVALCSLTALRTHSATRTANLPIDTETDDFEESAAVLDMPKPGWPLLLLWTVLAACSSVLLLAVTTHLTQNVAAIPFLWVLPLSLYLLSFIVCFGSQIWEWKPAFLAFPPLLLVGMGYALCNIYDNSGVKLLVILFSAGLFVCCVLCHGELARLKPHPRYLTSFYLMMSLGGALGGLFVGVLAPYLFRDYYELPLAIGACAVIALFALYREPGAPWWEPGRSWLILCTLTIAGLTFFFLGIRDTEIKSEDGKFVLTERNFYGVLRVSESGEKGSKDELRTLTNGTITHGSQLLYPTRRREPTTYYGRDSGVGLAIRIGQAHPEEKVGVIGLGTGTLACYSRPGDTYRFYELNPLDAEIAGTQFTFLSDSKAKQAKIDVVLGDARLMLEQQTPQNFDVLAVDAFSSDAIPVHLLTLEAMKLYFKHIKPDGVVAVHVSNRYLNLQPVVEQIAKELGRQARLVYSDPDGATITAAEWVLVPNSRAYFTNALLKDRCKEIDPQPGLQTWTDDFSNLFQVLDVGQK